MNKSKSYLTDLTDLTELNIIEQKRINGGGGEGTLADEIGWLLGRIWRDIKTAHKARAQGQIMAHQ